MKKLKKLTAVLLCCCVLLFCVPQAGPLAAAQTKELANLVIFVDFSDTDHAATHNESIMGQCLLQDPQTTLDLFNGDAKHPFGLRYYLSQVSYGQLQLTNFIPQCDGDAIKPFRLSHPASYYAGSGDIAMVREALTLLNASGKLPSGSRVDRDGDGFVDNVTVVVPCESGNSNSLFNDHRAYYIGDETVAGKKVSNYNVLTESAAYYDSCSGVVIHEYLHTLGYPDLYTRQTDTYPVGRWDIMSQTLYFVQYPLAYFRSTVSKWFSIPTVTSSRSGVKLVSALDSTSSNKDRQAIILKTDYSDSEFFVVEYRRQGSLYNTASGACEYDCKIPGSGLIVYRVNTALQANTSGPPYMTYVFRSGDHYTSGGWEHAEQTLMDKSYLSAESGCTAYGNADLTKSLSDGAITYSDGTNSGIVIRNVGSALGSEITFDIAFTPLPEKDFWKTEATQSDPAYALDSVMASDGTLYFLEKKDNATSGSVYLYRYSGGAWTRCSTALSGAGYDYHLAEFGGQLYVGYASGSGAKLVKWNGTAWKELYSSGSAVNEVALTTDKTGLYFAYADSACKKLYVRKILDGGAALLGTTAGESSYLSNFSLAAENGKVALLYREYLNNNRLQVKLYDQAKNSWSSVGTTTLSAGSCGLFLKNGTLYLLKNGGSSSSDNSCWLYTCGLAAGSDWKKAGSGVYADEPVTGMDLCLVGDMPYVAYVGGASKQTVVKRLSGGRWENVGARLCSEVVSGLKLHRRDGTLYAAYLTEVNRTVTLQYYRIGGHVHDYQVEITKEPTYLQEGEGTYTCSECQDTYTDIVPCKENPFVDVKPSYYYTPVLWALDRNVTKGVDATHFAPGATCSRAQVVSFLWRFAGQPEPTTSISPFKDVQNPGKWYYKAILWAAENGITYGIKPDVFDPDGPVTRGQFVTFLWRYAGEPAHTAANPFNDLAERGYYYDAVLWANEREIAMGVGSGAFAPDKTCTRGQTVSFLYRY